MNAWYVELNNVVELAEFLNENRYFGTANDVLMFISNPQNYNSHWKLLQIYNRSTELEQLAIKSRLEEEETTQEIVDSLEFMSVKEAIGSLVMAGINVSISSSKIGYSSSGVCYEVYCRTTGEIIACSDISGNVKREIIQEWIENA